MNNYPPKIPFVYLIGWSKLNKWYYGKRTAKGCHPNELWITYFTSSEYVKRFRQSNGEPDVIEIRHTFSNDKLCSLWEHKVLRRLNAKKSPMWLNENNASNDMDTTGKAPAKSKDGENLGLISVNDERWKTGDIVGINRGKGSSNKSDAIKRIRKEKYWSSTSDASKENNRKSALEWHADPNRNKRHRDALRTPEYRDKKSAEVSGEKNYWYGKNRTGKENPMFGKKQKILECPHCGKVGGTGGFNRWHFDNCKAKIK